MGGSGYWEVAYAYAKATGGRNTLRRTQTTLPGGEVFKFHYRTGTASHDDKYSRVTTVRDAEDTDLAGYQYNGAGQVVRTELSEVGIFSKAYNGSGTTFGRLDRFNRTLISSWTRDLATNRDIYKVTLGYDRNSNITSQDDAVHTGHDVAYANDDLNRLIDADEGTLSSGSIGTRTRRQQWTLNQTGNWNRDKVDLNGDADYLDAGELDDTRTHNAVNELLTRDTNTSSPAEFSLTYDAAGNMTDDGVYKYEWDAFYRLRKVKNQSNALVSEYWYNGLGYLVTRQQDTDADGDVDGSDLKFHTAYDERWRQVATYRGSDANPKERFLYHWAGDGGFGGSSYIDSVVLRDRDMTNGWTGAADGTLEERVYYLQNWRADLVGLVEPDGSGGATMVEWVKYSAYGVPFGLPAGDTDSDGDCDSTDDAQVTTWKNAPLYDVRGDLDLDGVVDAADETLVGSAHQSLGRGVLTSTSVGNRKGYAGYEGDAKLSAKWHVRNRVLDSVLGRWLRRDPIGYVDGVSLGRYVGSAPIASTDPFGLELYAIDGTNMTEESGTIIAQARKRYAPYQGDTHYEDGPGLGPLDAPTAKNKVYNEICRDWCEKHRAGLSLDIDLIGYSRGAAVALQVADKLNREGCCCDRICHHTGIKVRFLGLVDTVNVMVHSPSVTTVPTNVKYAVHIAKQQQREALFPTATISGANLIEIKDIRHQQMGGSAEVLYHLENAAGRAGVLFLDPFSLPAQVEPRLVPGSLGA